MRIEEEKLQSKIQNQQSSFINRAGLIGLPGKSLPGRKSSQTR
jgi:hypothetical protein